MKRESPQLTRPGAPSTSNEEGALSLTALPGHQRHGPLDAEDRADLAVLLAAAERGYRLATRCLDCGHWLVNQRSVLAHRGPRCRAKQVVS